MALTVILTFALAGFQLHGQQEAHEELSKALELGIALLEAQRYEDFVIKFVPRERLSRVSVREFAKSFADRHAKGALAALKAARQIEPELSSDMKTATYTLTPPVANRKELTLKRIGNRWYFDS